MIDEMSSLITVMRVKCIKARAHVMLWSHGRKVVIFSVVSSIMVEVVKLMLKIHLALKLLFLVIVLDLAFNGSVKIFLDQMLLTPATIVRLQVREGFMKLTHENIVISLAKVGVIVSTELVVAIDHVTDALHHGLNSGHGAHTISITVHDSQWSVIDVLNGDV